LQKNPRPNNYKIFAKARIGRRTVRKEAEQGTLEYMEPKDIYNLIVTGPAWPYKTRRQFYQTRDRALPALLYLTSGRVNEVLRVHSGQFHLDEEDPDFMVLRGFYVSKRKEGRPHPILDIPLPLVGSLAPLTQLVVGYLELLPQGERLFNFGRSRALAIVKHLTGRFCHWFRAQSLSYQVNLLRSTVAVAQQRGVENPSTLAHYYRGNWRQFRAELKK